MAVNIWNIFRGMIANPPAETIDAFYVLRQRPIDAERWQHIDGTKEYRSFGEAVSALDHFRTEAVNRMTAIAVLSKESGHIQRALIVLARPPWRGTNRSWWRRIVNVVSDAIHDWEVQMGRVPLVFGERRYRVEYFSGSQWVKFEEAPDVQTALVRVKELRKAARTRQDDDYRHAAQGFPAGIGWVYSFRVKEYSSRDHDEAIVVTLGSFTREQKYVLATGLAVLGLLFSQMLNGPGNTPARSYVAGPDRATAQAAMDAQFLARKIVSGVFVTLPAAFAHRVWIKHPESKALIDRVHATGRLEDWCEVKAATEAADLVRSDRSVPVNQIEHNVDVYFERFAARCLTGIGSTGSVRLTILTPENRRNILLKPLAIAIAAERIGAPI